MRDREREARQLYAQNPSIKFVMETMGVGSATIQRWVAPLVPVRNPYRWNAAEVERFKRLPAMDVARRLSRLVLGYPSRRKQENDAALCRKQTT